MLDCEKHDNSGGVKLKNWAIPILVLVMLVAGCAKPVNVAIPPLAYIDSVSSSEIYVGDKIKFSGHGFTTNGEIVAYNWRSSINGDLSKLASFEINTLDAGAHTIWFKVQNNYGYWSTEAGTSVNVLARGGPAKMQIKIFSASSPSIKEGDWSTLTWEVTGLGTVRIDPDIGNVSSSGSRAVRPWQDTVYTLFGTNDMGMVSATTKVTVTALPTNTLILYSIAGEGGTVRKDKVVLGEVLVGENELQVQMQGFLSFDISAIPPDAIIKRVDLDLTAVVVYGSPFPNQGSLNIYNQQYGPTLKSNDYMVIVPTGYLYSWNYTVASTNVPQQPFSNTDFVNAVQKQVDARSNRFQIRLQFEKYYYYGRPDYSYTQSAYNVSYSNYIDIGAGNPKLIIRYIIPD